MSQRAVPFAVVNPGGRDPSQDFSSGAGNPATDAHPPVNFHAYAACLRGGFYQNAAEVPEGTPAALVLLRRDMNPAQEAIAALRQRGMIVCVSFKETGFHQVEDALRHRTAWRQLRHIAGMASAYIAATPALAAIYEAAGIKRGEFFPTPYPLDEKEWNFESPLREGIFVGTREFDVPTRHHALALRLALAMAEEANSYATVINAEGWSARRKLREISEGFNEKRLRVVEGRRPYTEYLRIMAGHRLVFQLDRSEVPGQVCGDALLCRIPCVGGNSALEQVLGTDCAGHAPMRLAARLLADESFYESWRQDWLERARTTVSFSAVAERLTSFLASLS